MAAFELNFATVALGLAIILAIVCVIYRTRKKGMCDCKECTREQGVGKDSASGTHACAGCKAFSPEISPPAKKPRKDKEN
jgi:hypothetical protein